METKKFIENLTQEVGEILLSFSHSKNFSTSQKPDHTFVTDADIAANNHITKSINEAYPKDNILSEEGSTTYDPSFPATWVIDPLDGTNNFALGLPIWGCSIARIIKGVPQTSAIFFPQIDELYSAEKNQGSFLNGEVLDLSTKKEDKISIFLSCTRSIKMFTPPPPYKLRVLGAAAYDLCLIAKNGAIAGMQATPKIWDIAAGELILCEAGGHVETLSDIKPFPMNESINYASQPFRILMAKSLKIAKVIDNNMIA